jgi:hypothetical protein
MARSRSPRCTAARHAEALAGLALDPGAQPDLQRAVLGFERPRGQRLGRVRIAVAGREAARLEPDRQDARFVNAGRDDDGGEADRQRRRLVLTRRFSRALRAILPGGAPQGGGARLLH